MQGGGKGLIEAGGSVHMLYVERGTIRADGPIVVDVCIHSTVETGDTLIVTGRKGAIIGGRVGASRDIIANFIGALSHARTEVTVGVMPRKRTRLQFLEQELKRLSGDQMKLDQLDAYLKKSKDTMDPKTWEKLHLSSIENRKLNAESISHHLIEMDGLKYELERATDSKAHVFETVFSGARVLIGTDTYIVNDEIKYVSFRYRDGQVVYGPCEISKTG